MNFIVSYHFILVSVLHTHMRIVLHFEVGHVTTVRNRNSHHLPFERFVCFNTALIPTFFVEHHIISFERSVFDVAVPLSPVGGYCSVSRRFLLNEKLPLKSLSRESLEERADLGKRLRLILMQGLCRDKERLIHM